MRSALCQNPAKLDFRYTQNVRRNLSMFKIYNPNQIVLFPDLFNEVEPPPITSLPDFDRALDNFIKLSDFGAFIHLSFHGIEKSYSLNLNELKIRRKYLNKITNISSPVHHLLPDDIHNKLMRFKYEALSFFSQKNSLKTSIGYFLLRRYFHQWELHRKKVLDNISKYLQSDVGEEKYEGLFAKIWNSGVNWLNSIFKKKSPYSILQYSSNMVKERRSQFEKAGVTLSQLDEEQEDYLTNCLILKTLHIPQTLSEYISGISIDSIFRTIHLEYLKSVKIESINDIKHLFDLIEEQQITG